MQPQTAREKGSEGLACSALSEFDAPCSFPAITHCGKCDHWFCSAHEGDHACVSEEDDDVGGEG
jgi:hypothetical protein